MGIYTATISHHSISRAREITVTGSLLAAKRAATKEFGGGFVDHEIDIYDVSFGDPAIHAACRRIGERAWR